jgi:hypothetical protein
VLRAATGSTAQAVSRFPIDNNEAWVSVWPSSGTKLEFGTIKVE